MIGWKSWIRKGPNFGSLPHQCHEGSTRASQRTQSELVSREVAYSFKLGAKEGCLTECGREPTEYGYSRTWSTWPLSRGSNTQSILNGTNLKYSGVASLPLLSVTDLRSIYHPVFEPIDPYRRDSTITSLAAARPAARTAAGDEKKKTRNKPDSLMAAAPASKQ